MRQLKISRSITSREEPSLDKYLADIAKIGLITDDEEVELSRQIKDGDLKALEKLCKANLRFVVSVAKQYQNQGLSLPDLIGEGNVGLIKAAQRFDEKRGFKFISYAVWWIRQAILQAIAEHGRAIRLPLNQVGLVNKTNKISNMLEQRLERIPTTEELSVEINLPAWKINEARLNGLSISSLDAPRPGDEEGDNLIDMLSNESKTDDDVIRESLKNDIYRSINTLPTQRERDVLKMYFGLGVTEPMTLDEISRRINLIRESVRQIKEKAMRRMRCSNRNKNLRKYLG